ncbi:MAG: sigma 54-interacting transcriptional regulator [Deltaproteobacteria bacterium]|nr:sigma 54-interacting transcriptional regulator [Deltaproteobacteria bacterium]
MSDLDPDGTASEKLPSQKPFNEKTFASAPTRQVDEKMDEEASALLFSEDARPEGGLALLLHHREGTQVVSLAPGSDHILGRDPLLVDVALRDSLLSRRHARFWLDDGELWVEDLGSTNGTYLNGTRLRRRQLNLGEEITFGGATALVTDRTRAFEAAKAVISHELWLAIVDHELQRARFFQDDPIALLWVEATDRDHPHLSRWLPELTQQLRPVDRLALYAPHAVEVLLPRLDVAGARKVAEAFVSATPLTLRCGVTTFPEGGSSAAKLLQRCREAAQRSTAAQCVVAAVPSTRGEDSESSSEWVCESAAMSRLMPIADRLAQSDLTVLVAGETGTGKEVLARYIHRASTRAEKPFVVVDCAGIPHELIEATLFGHEKGAFTGAAERRMGLFEHAQGGTIFLDEIGELSINLQPKLLRVLDTKELRRVGGTQTIPVDVRVIAATNRNLTMMVTERQFRSDLHYRLGDDPIRIPPLRERVEAIPSLVKLFAHDASNDEDSPPTTDQHTMELLQSYHWPGNVRELRNVIERAVVIGRGQTITADDLPARVRMLEATPMATEDAPEFKVRVARYETRLILDALQQCGGNQKRAAARLRIPLRTLGFKIKAHGIRIPHH